MEMKNFSVFPLKDRKQRQLAVEFTDKETGKTHRFSLDKLAKEVEFERDHITNMGQAHKVIQLALAKGLLGNRKKDNTLFCDYLTKFWTFDTSEYIKKKNKKSSIHRGHVNNMLACVKNHISPLLPKDLKCSQVKRKHIEKIQNYCIDNRSIDTWHKVLECLSQPIKELLRSEILLINPLLNLETYPQNRKSNVKELTEEETRMLIARMFNDSYTGYKAIEKRGAKNGHFKEVEVQAFLDRRVYLATAVGVNTGMRQGEILALRECDIELPTKDSEEECAFIHIEHSYSKYDGLKGTKSNRPRTVPIELWLANELLEWAKTNPIQAPEGNHFIFYSNKNPEKPVFGTTITKWFNKELEHIGISEQERKEKHIVFHSLRHGYVTQLRDKQIPEVQIRLLTGHSNIAMTDRYDTGDKTNRVKNIAGRIGSLINNPKKQEA